MGPSLLVKRFRREVDAVGPDERSRIGVYRSPSQVGRVVQRLKDTCPVLGGEVDQQYLSDNKNPHGYCGPGGTGAGDPVG